MVARAFCVIGVWRVENLYIWRSDGPGLQYIYPDRGRGTVFGSERCISMDLLGRTTEPCICTTITLLIFWGFSFSCILLLSVDRLTVLKGRLQYRLMCKCGHLP